MSRAWRWGRARDAAEKATPAQIMMPRKYRSLREVIVFASSPIDAASRPMVTSGQQPPHEYLPGGHGLLPRAQRGIAVPKSSAAFGGRSGACPDPVGSSDIECSAMIGLSRPWASAQGAKRPRGNGSKPFFAS